MSLAEIAMTIPADSRFVSTVRVAAANLAAELDFSVDEIEELRMGANEIVTTLVEYAIDLGLTSVELRYGVSDASIEMTGTVPGAEGSSELVLDFLAEQILDSVVDEYELSSPTLSFRKRRSDR